MRYRRIYTSRNADGSRSVLSVGPGAGCTYLFGKWLFWTVVLFLPLALQSAWHGTGGVILSWVLEVPWFVLVVGGTYEARKAKRLGPGGGGSSVPRRRSS